MLAGLPKAPIRGFAVRRLLQARQAIASATCSGRCWRTSSSPTRSMARRCTSRSRSSRKDTPLNHVAAPYFVEHVRKHRRRPSTRGRDLLRSRPPHLHDARHAQQRAAEARGQAAASRRRSSLRLPRPGRAPRRRRAADVPRRHADAVQPAPKQDATLRAARDRAEQAPTWRRSSARARKAIRARRCAARA